MTTMLPPPAPETERTGGLQAVQAERRRRRSFGPLVILLITSVIGFLILTLIGTIVVIAFSQDPQPGPFTLDNYAQLFSDPFALQALGNTVVYVIIATVTAVLIGVPVAWLVARTDLPGKTAITSLFIIGVLIPGFFVAMGWLLLFQPKAGIANRLFIDVFGIEAPGPFNIVTVPGMGLVTGLSLASVVFVMTSTTFRTMNVSLEEAVRTSGGTFWHQLTRVTLPLAWPSILAATLYVAIIAFGAFDIPAVIGLTAREYTFSTFLYYNVHPQTGLPRYGLVAAFSTFMIIVGILLSWAYTRVLKRGDRYRVVTGKNYRPATLSLGKWKGLVWTGLGLYFLFAMLLPLLAVVWAALLPYLQPPSPEAFAAISLDNLWKLPWKNIGTAIVNTLILVALVPTLALLFSTALSWVTTRSKYRFRALYEYVAFVPHAVPSLILGVGAILLVLFLLPTGWGLYGSVALLVIVMSLEKVSFGTRMTNTGFLQIHPELEEAASVAGAGTFTAMRRVLLPLLRATYQSGWLWIAILTFRELTLPLILYSPKNITLATAAWNLWSGGQQGQAAMITVLMLIAVTPLALIYQRFAKNVSV